MMGCDKLCAFSCISGKCCLFRCSAAVAQRTVNPLVAGSNPATGATSTRLILPATSFSGKRGQLADDWNLVVFPSEDGQAWEETQ